MKKTTIILALTIALMIMLPTVTAQTAGESGVVKALENIWNGVKNILGKQDFTKEGIEAFLRFALIIIFYIVVHAVLTYSIKKTGKEGILKKEAIIVISLASAIITAVVMPFELILKGATIIVIWFLGGLLLKAVYEVWKESDKIEGVGKLFGYTALTALFTFGFLQGITKMSLGSVALSSWTGSQATLQLLFDLGLAATIILAGLTVVGFVLYKQKNRAPEAAPETEEARATREAGEERSTSAAGRTRRATAVRQKKQRALNAITSLIERLEGMVLAARNNDRDGFVGSERNYSRAFAQVVAAEGELQTEIGTSGVTIPKRLQAVIDQETDLMGIITAANKEITNVINHLVRNPATTLQAGTKDQIQNVISRRMIPVLKMLAQVNEREETAATTP